MSLFDPTPVYSRVVFSTAAQLAAPTQLMLDDLAAIYQLDTPPYTRYYSDGTALNVMVDDAVINATATTVNALNQIVLNLPTTSYLLARENHTGVTPATNVTMSSGESLEEKIEALLNAIAGMGPSAPIVTANPTFTGDPADVGDTITATAGAVTEGSGGSHTNEWYISQVPADLSPVFVLSGWTSVLPGASTYSFNVPASMQGDKFFITQTPIDSTGLRGNSRQTVLSTAIGATVPNNTVAPSISPNGSQVVGQEHTVDTGTWDDASTYGIQFYYNSVPFGSRTATTTITTDDTKAGSTLTFDVIAYSTLGVPSTPEAGSNSVTLTGVPVVENTVLPAWPATIYFGVVADFTEGTWTGDIETGRTWQFFRNSETQAYVSPPNTLSLHTPRSPAIVGDTLYIEETVIQTGTGHPYTVRSLGKVITETPVALDAALTLAGITGYTWIQGSAISQANPVTITGGTSPYSAQMSPAISGLTVSVSGSNVYINGTPANTVASTSYTITVTDNVAATDTASFTAVVNSPSVTPLPALVYSEANVAISGDNTAYNGINPHYYNGVVTIGPNGDGRTRHRLVQGAPSISGGVRNELLWFNERLIEGQTLWFAFDILFDIPGEFPVHVFNSYDYFVIMQAHTAMSGDTQPDILCDVNYQSTPATIKWRIAGQDATPSGGSTTTKEPQPAYFGSQTLVQGIRNRFVVEMVPGWLSSQGPKINIWARNGSSTTWTQLVTNYTTYPNTYNNGGDTNNRSYLRIGGYKFTGSVWNNSPISWVSSTLYVGRGTGLFDRAAASLSQLPG